MQIRWSDLGKPDKPGFYTFHDCRVRVDTFDIDVWRRFPDAVFTLKLVDLVDEQLQGALGDYKVPNGH